MEWTGSPTLDGIVFKGGGEEGEYRELDTLMYRYGLGKPGDPATNIGFRCARDAKGGTPLDMVRIPGGEYQLGGSRHPAVMAVRLYLDAYHRKASETDAQYTRRAGSALRRIVGEPMHDYRVSAIRIDRTEVTNADYALFLKHLEQHPADAEKVRHPDQPESKKDHVPQYWHEHRFNAPEQPVVGVDWYDAWAYANWVGKRLPSQQEWVYAVRGSSKRLYPWGDGFDTSQCMTQERGLSKPVAADAEGAWVSPQGVLHLAGNVAEWVVSDDTESDYQIVMGGSWETPGAIYAMAGYQARVDDEGYLIDRLYRSRDVGFRCVRDEK